MDSRLLRLIITASGFVLVASLGGVPSVLAQDADPIPAALQQYLKRAGIAVPPANELQSSSGPQAATLVPLIYAENLQASVSASGEVTGTFTIINRDDTYVGGIGYDIAVLGPEALIQPGVLTTDTALTYHRQRQPDSFSLAAQQSKQISFTYQPPPLPAGDFRLRVQLRTSNDREMGWDTVAINLPAGAEPVAFAELEAIAVETASINYETGQIQNLWGPLQGVNVDAKQTLAFQVTAKNVGTAGLNVTPTLSIKRILTSASDAAITSGEQVSLAAGATQRLSLPTTAGDTPGAYAAIFSLQNDQLKQVSSLAEFRYVVRGVSASIVSAEIEKLARNKGDAAVVQFTVVGPADRETDLPGKIQVAILSGQEVAGQTEEDVRLNGSAVTGTASIELNRDVSQTPGLRITLTTTDGTVLDQYEISLPDILDQDLAAAQPPEDTESRLRGRQIAGIVLAILAVAVAIVLIFIIRAGKLPPSTPAIFVLLILGAAAVILQHFPANASGIQFRHYWWHGGWGAPQLNLFVNKPAHNSTVSPGQIPYEAKLEWVACENSFNEGSIIVSSLPSGGHVTFKTAAQQSGSSFTPTGTQETPYDWLEQARRKEERTFDPSGWRSFTFKTLLDLATHAPGSTTTIWTQADAFATYHTGWSYGIINDFTWLTFLAPSPSASPTPTVSPPGDSCLAYAVQGSPQSGPDSKFFTIDIAAGAATGLGAERGTPKDLTGLDIHPTSGLMYAAASGSNNTTLYKVDRSSGATTAVGTTGGRGVQALSFRPSDATLWGWAEDKGVVTINTSTGETSLIRASDLDIEGLAWNGSGSLLYGSANDALWVFDPAAKTLSQLANNLPGGTKALETVPGRDNLLLGGIPDSGHSVSLYLYDVTSTRVISRKNFTSPYNHMESVAWPQECGLPWEVGIKQCSDTIDNDADGKVDCEDPGCLTDINNPASCDPDDDQEQHTPQFKPPGFQETE